MVVSEHHYYLNRLGLKISMGTGMILIT